MSPVIYQRCHIVASRTLLAPEGLLGPRFLLKLTFSATGQPLEIAGVHLTDEAQALTSSGRVSGISVEVLQANSLPASLLGSPHQLVTGVELDDGKFVPTIPELLRKVRLWGLLATGSACLGAMRWLFAVDGNVASALLPVAATHAVRSLVAIPIAGLPTTDVER